MNLDIFNDLINKVKENDLVQNFITELSNHLEKNDNKPDGKNEKQVDMYREENCLYQVVDFSANGVYLQNTQNNKTFEETNLPQELKDKIGNDYILRYKNGEYIYEEEITENFMNSMVEIQEYKKIQENFIKESGIDKIDSNTRFKVISREEDYTILEYNNDNKIQVPNELIPFFADNTSILYYKDGKFEKDV